MFQTSLPVLDNPFSQRLRDMIDSFRAQRSRYMKVNGCCLRWVISVSHNITLFRTEACGTSRNVVVHPKSGSPDHFRIDFVIAHCKCVAEFPCLIFARSKSQFIINCYLLHSSAQPQPPPPLLSSLLSQLMLVKQEDRSELIFRHFLMEDKNASGGASYVDFLCHMHKEIRQLLS